MAIPKLNNVYVGERYIPKYEGTWDSTKDYEGLTIVSYNNSSYVSRRPVPAGTALDNETYWALMTNFGGQLQTLQEQVNAIQAEIDSGELAGGAWTSAETLGLKPGIDIGTLVSNLPANTPNIAFPAGTYTVDTACTFSMPVYFAPGAIIQPNAAVTFTKPVKAERYQIFAAPPSTTGSNISIPNDVVYPEWFGWMGDGILHQNEATQMFNSITNAVLSIGAGIYKADNAKITFAHNLIIEGLSAETSIVQIKLNISSVDYFILNNTHFMNSVCTLDNIPFIVLSSSHISSATPTFTITDANTFHLLNSRIDYTTTSIAQSFIEVTQKTDGEHSLIVENTTVNAPNTQFLTYNTANNLNPGGLIFNNCKFKYYSFIGVIGQVNTDTIVDIQLTNCYFDKISPSSNPLFNGTRTRWLVDNCVGNMPGSNTAKNSKFSNCTLYVTSYYSTYLDNHSSFTNCTIVFTDMTYPGEKCPIMGYYDNCTFKALTESILPIYNSQGENPCVMVNCQFDNVVLDETNITTFKNTILQTTINSTKRNYTNCSVLLIGTTDSVSLAILENGVIQPITSAVKCNGSSLTAFSNLGSISNNRVTFTADSIGQAGFQSCQIAYGEATAPKYYTFNIKLHN